MIEKTPYIDDVNPGQATRAEWGNVIRDAAAAHYPGGSFVGSSRGGYHRPPMMAAAADSTIRTAMLVTDLYQGGECQIQEYTYDASGNLCVAASTLTAHHPRNEFEGTAYMACVDFWMDPTDPLGRASLLTISCPQFECTLCQTGTGTGTATGTATGSGTGV